MAGRSHRMTNRENFHNCKKHILDKNPFCAVIMQAGQPRESRHRIANGRKRRVMKMPFSCFFFEARKLAMSGPYPAEKPKQPFYKSLAGSPQGSIFLLQMSHLRMTISYLAIIAQQSRKIIMPNRVPPHELRRGSRDLQANGPATEGQKVRRPLGGR